MLVGAEIMSKLAVNDSSNKLTKYPELLCMYEFPTVVDVPCLRNRVRVLTMEDLRQHHLLKKQDRHIKISEILYV